MIRKSFQGYNTEQYDKFWIYRDGDNYFTIKNVSDYDYTEDNSGYNEHSAYRFYENPIESGLDVEMFPELLMDGVKLIITNDGIIAIFCTGVVIVYDIINDDYKATFSNIEYVDRDPNKPKYTTSNNPLNYHWITCKSNEKRRS